MMSNVNPPKPCAHRGTIYGSMTAACKATGMCMYSIRIRCERGVNGWRFLSQKEAPPRKPIDRTVTVRGVKYATVTEAAAAIGVPETTIRSAKARGRLDRISVGPVRGVKASQPVTDGTTIWPSMQAAAKTLGIAPETVKRRIVKKKGNLTFWHGSPAAIAA